MEISVQTISHFEFGSIRFYSENGTFYFYAMEFAIFLGYKKRYGNARNALDVHCPNIFKKVVPTGKTSTYLLLIPEADALNLIQNTNTQRASECLAYLHSNGLFQEVNVLNAIPIEPEVLQSEPEQEPIEPEVKNDIDIQTFKHELFGSIRIVMKDGVPWFIGSDVAIALGYEKPENAIARHCKKSIKSTFTPFQGKEKPIPPINILLIPESDLYRLIMRSNLPEAEKFQDWVCEEVLPSIRKHGMYATDNVLEQAIGNPDFVIGLLSNIKEEREQRKLAEQARDKAIREKGWISTKQVATALKTAQTEKGRAIKAITQLAKITKQHEIVVKERNDLSRKCIELQDENNKLTNEKFLLELDNEDLKEQIGNSTHWKEIKAWYKSTELNEIYNNASEYALNLLGSAISDYEKQFNYSNCIRKIQDQTYGEKNIYHITLINGFIDLAKNKTSLFKKFMRTKVKTSMYLNEKYKP